MSISQLQIEYENMTDRHDLYAKFGISAEAAQLFETELGTLMLCVRALDEGWHINQDPEAAKSLLNSIDRSTLGRLLSDIKRHLAIEDDLLEVFQRALKSRNRLMHGFFERHNFKIQTEEGREKMIADLNGIHGELFAAWQLASNLTVAFSAIINEGKRQGV